MPAKANSAPGYELFQPQDTDIAIQFADAARERVLSEVMTGFGAVPRRGAEVGGILLGRREADAIWVEDAVLTPCEHRRGPSFLLSERDRQNLENLMRDLRASGGETYPVGMFRSNTREPDAVSDEDREVFRAFFPPPEGLFMLIRPYATKPSTVSFLLYRAGALPDSSETLTLQRPGGESPGRRRPLGVPPVAPDRADYARPEQVLPPATAGPAATTAVAAAPDALNENPSYGDEYLSAAPSGTRRRNWMLVPLSFIFLLLGVLLGFQSALTFYPQPKPADATAFTAGLTAARKGENLHIRWNREALAITSARGGTLEIEDGAYRRSVELDASALKNGSVIYPPVSDRVTLRFDIAVNSGTRLIETLVVVEKPE
jgi:hypothetical protein